MNRSFHQEHENLIAAISDFLKNVRIFVLSLTIYFLCCSAAIHNILCFSLHLYCRLSCSDILNSSLLGLGGLVRGLTILLMTTVWNGRLVHIRWPLFWQKETFIFYIYWTIIRTNCSIMHSKLDQNVILWRSFSN